MAGGGMRMEEAVIGSGVAVLPVANLPLGMDGLSLLLGRVAGNLPITMYLSVR